MRSQASDYSWNTMPPPYSSPATTASERTSLLGQPIKNSRGPIRALVICLVVIAVVTIGVPAWHLGLKPQHQGPQPTYSVAIIGAGPAGIAAAQYLLTSPAARNVHFNITIYESKPVIGGALAFHHTNGSVVFPKNDPTQIPIMAEDVAGKALVWNNPLFTRDSEKVLNDKIKFIELAPEQIGYYSDTRKTAEATRPYSQMPTSRWLQLLWTYGNSVWRGNKLAQDGILRKAILKVPLVPNVGEIFNSLGVRESLHQSARYTLKGRGISDQYANDILEPQIQRAYGQRLDHVTGFTAMMAVAQQEFANAYQGGHLTERLQRIADNIDVDVRKSTRVVTIKHVEATEKHPSWLVQHEGTGGDAGGGSGKNVSIEIFDKIIIAALDLDIRVESDDERVLDLARYYNIDANTVKAAPAHVTFLTSDTKLAPWNLDDDQALFLGARGVAGMRELALVRDIVTYDDDGNALVEYLYRVLSESPVLEELRTHAKITWSYQTRIEKAYPIILPSQRLPPFKLVGANGFWWTSVIQRAGTSVDLNWLAGKIVAQDLIKEVTPGWWGIAV